MGIEARNRLADDFRGSMGRFAAFAAVVTLLYHVAMLLVGQADGIIDLVFFRTLPTLVLTTLAFAPFAHIISHATGNALTLGGKPSKSSRSHGSRYELDL